MNNERGGGGGSSMTWSRVGGSALGVAARCLLLCFTTSLALKLDDRISCSWWIIFASLWLFHIVVTRHRFSLPAPSFPHGRHWAPCHSLVATPLLIAFELLLCIYLENIDARNKSPVNLKIVFLPLLAFELTILVDNFRICRTLVPADGDNIDGEILWEILPHFWIAISMVFLVAATSFMLLKLCGDVDTLGWWDIFINLGIAECFAFLVCTKWSNSNMHRVTQQYEEISTNFYSLNSSSLTEDHNIDGLCGLQDIGGHIMKVPLIVFQILLCMRLEGTPANVRYLPIFSLFSLIFLIQGAGIMFATWRLAEKLILLLYSGPPTAQYISFSSRVYDCFAFIHRGSRLLGWWSIDEGSKEEHARLYHEGITRYNTFSVLPPELVKKMSKKDLVEEIRRLQEELAEQMETRKHSQQAFERLQNDKILCRVCFEGEICVVLIPCRHWILCMTCAERCTKCPICRVNIEEIMQLCNV